MTVAGGGLSLMNAMISTEHRMRLQHDFLLGGDDSPIIIKSTEFFPLCGQSGAGGKRGKVGESQRTDRSETIRRIEVRIGGWIALETICLVAEGMP